MQLTFISSFRNVCVVADTPHVLVQINLSVDVNNIVRRHNRHTCGRHLAEEAYTVT